jgi:hypothetical protein
MANLVRKIETRSQLGWSWPRHWRSQSGMNQAAERYSLICRARCALWQRTNVVSRYAAESPDPVGLLFYKPSANCVCGGGDAFEHAA